MAVFIDTTPNPSTRKFTLDHYILPPGQAPLYYTDAQSAHTAPLARHLFAHPGVKSVFLGDMFVSITKADTMEWDDIETPIKHHLEHYLDTKSPILDPFMDPHDGIDHIDHDPKDQQILQTILELINTRVRPYIQSDGGDITVLAYRDDTLWVNMQGACVGCPSSRSTIRVGLTTLLRHYVSPTLTIESASG